MNRKAQIASPVEDDLDAYPLPADSVPEPLDPADIAGYIAEMTDELAKMAANSGLETICYLLTLVRLEAETFAGDDKDAD
ncbi:MAG: hypothetical protein Q8M31_23430 [Beijerinckiaceae bacterium]|nr:hypothetical protein [Beijerinckiaceae bacterium]